ncbi:MAG: formylglycine-generating enzyme family protein [Gallionella sp.]
MSSTKHVRLLGIFAVVYCGSAAWAAEETPLSRYQHTVQASESCEACHARNLVNIFKSAMANDCMECHTSGDDNSVQTVADTEMAPAAAETEGSASNSKNEEKKYVDVYAERVKVAPPPDETAGMSVPIFYSQTRIGKEPGEMVLVPAGKFIRGSNNRLPDEGPEYVAETKAFWIDKFEVSNLQYKQFVDATKRKSPKHWRNRNYPEGRVDHPVVFVSWFDAYDYCKWAGRRLPTDIEWEKAARGTDGRNFPWGDEFDVNKVNSPVRWAALHIEGGTTPVGAFEGGKSPYGAYDMSGNVWEWTDSWYTQYPGNQWPSENYGELYKVLKGGSWWDCSFYQCGVSAPSFNRSYFKQNIKNSSFGFRCAKDDE